MTEFRQPSPRRGTNLPKMGDFNLTVILDAIRRAPGGLSRVELAQIVGLSPQTISNISRRLLDQHLIVEAGKEGTGPGKPRTMLRLNPAGMYAVGVHLDPAVLTFVVLDLLGAVVRHSRISTPPGTDPRAVIDTIAAEIKRLIAGLRGGPGPDRRARALRPRARSTSTRAPSWTRRCCRAGTASGCGMPSPTPPACPPSWTRT